jgi:Cd2+/Zn2+-exporting ATPase
MDHIQNLVQIGFTEYEAKVYLALLSDFPATGYQLSKASGVPRSMVYESLRRLHARGAALETVEERATLYRPVPPGILLDRHEAQHVRLVSDLRQGLTELFRDASDERVWTLSGRSTILAYASQIIGGAKSEIFLVLTDDDLESLNGDLAAADNNGVAINALLTGSKTLDFGQVAFHPPLESELQELTTTLVVEADGDQLLIGSCLPQKTMSATVTRNSDLVFIARQFVWMELFTQRIYARLGADLLARLDPEDRRIFESLSNNKKAG